jgi:hypothetical protein
MWTASTSFGDGGVSYGVVIAKDEADRMLAALLEELRPLWLDRHHPSVSFSSYGQILGVTRDKAVLGDVDGDIAPLYRYRSHARAVVHPWTPTTLEDSQSDRAAHWDPLHPPRRQQVPGWNRQDRVSHGT